MKRLMQGHLLYGAQLLITRFSERLMDSRNAVSRLTDQPALDAIATPLSGAIRGVYESAGSAGQQVKNAMHGVWLGHPLHAVFTNLPLGAWTTGLVLDAVASVNRDRAMERATDVVIAVGLAGPGHTESTLSGCP